MSNAVLLRQVRAYYGLSQPQLIPWLGLSRVMLGQIETGREALPAHARPWLRAWWLALPASADDPSPPDDPGDPGEMPLAGPAALLARLAECRYQQQRLGQQLRVARQRLRYAERRLSAGPVLLAALPPLPDPQGPPEPAALAGRRRWLHRLFEAAADALLPEAPGGPTSVALLEARRSAWQHEAACLRAHLSAGS
ncbi:hypothetical protein [Hymenobacter sp. B81]|uniref:hypothetical protein n=1 Tax=Hymenobacter sp. B81 TaxID=3344878 RepID=UPI0037DC39AE